MSRRLPLILGVGAASGVGYYLYSAGGDTKVAQKQAEADMHSVSSKVKSELPGRGKEAEKDVEKYGAQAGQKIDSALAKTQAELQKAEAWAKENKNATLKKVDELDRKVEAEASKAKSGISSWFGGSK
ncbi:hypothetical protein F5Y15DRAFT_211566 [Xylariaceae sp. FL0016]|nr:hypothetical protein F5Y15DRAFT_211566 [Xylariaceae sp. FL0016]